ncbi:hypothetical protein LV164_000739 [Aspergillus fumigatus]|nr:hypothetical protein KXX42_002756 [Aspergillus fumigatus]KAH2662170.1 hypothetical protein KXV32_009412 [Aspergillus fumigatus]KAH2750779.1 hypothetical protein KXV94_002792 [Aspergillus fumigatus]KAH3535684.1 hypothetical protein KXV64_000347 [Aspergillus fumigatus]KAJ8193813.1 hypothetical protein LV157_002892 [Aspergillus fumigatus]
MDLVRKEHERLTKRLKASQNIKNVQDTIDLIQAARDTITSDPGQASMTLAKLQNSVKSSFDAINDNLKEHHSALNKYSKALDKLFKDKPLPSTEHDALSSREHLINRAIAMHLLREGQFSVAATFLSEIAEKKASTRENDMDTDGPDAAKSLLDIDDVPSDEVRKQFATMYHILHEMKENNNLLPAIQWSRENKESLEARGSNLEFELCRLQFVWLFHGGQGPAVAGPQAALEYARREFHVFLPRYLVEIQQLMGAMAFSPNLQESPYRNIFDNPSAWSDVAQSFTREFCSLLGLSADSPLYIAATAGAIALPTLLKLQTIMKAKRTEWTTQNELPSPADSSSSRYRIGKATASQRVRNPVRDSPSTPSRRVERRQRTGTSPTKSSPSTSIVTISVGPEARLFAAHEATLCISPFFAAACCRAQAQSPSPDSPNKRISISLPDEQPEILSCILECLYKGDYTPRAIYNRHRETWELENTGPDTNGQTTNATIFHHATGSVILRDTAVYCAAQKYGLEPLKRLALRKQGLHSGIQCSTILSSARYAYANTPDDESKLRAHYLALIIRCRSTFKRSGTMQMEMEKGGKLFFDLFVAMCNHMDDLAIAKSSLA